MTTLWTYLQDGKSASRTLDNGAMESRLVTAIPADELATAIAYTMPPAVALANYQQSALHALQDADKTFVRIQEAITLGLVTASDSTVVAWINY